MATRELTISGLASQNVSERCCIRMMIGIPLSVLLPLGTLLFIRSPTSILSQTTAILSLDFNTISDGPYPYPLYIPDRNFTVPLPSPIPNPPYGRGKTLIYSRIRNIRISSHASTEWDEYRLGDMFKSHTERGKKDGWRLHSRKYPDSIAVEYMMKIEDRFHGSDSDYSTMMQIVDDRIANRTELQSLMPDNNTLVIHLRTGDVIEDDTLPIREFLSFDNASAPKRRGRWMTRGLPFYADIWDHIQRDGAPIDYILVCTGWHYKIAHYRSIAYINEVIKYLEQMVDAVEIRINENPDEDFMIMSQSRYFVESGGGYSRMMGGMVKLNGGTVYGFRGPHGERLDTE